jgi:hypothetical protein
VILFRYFVVGESGGGLVAVVVAVMAAFLGSFFD